MANFWDLPKHVREKIYRLHLVREDRITVEEHLKILKYRWSGRCMPPLLSISKRAEKEAAHIYYSENHFDCDTTRNVFTLCWATWPRHLRMIRKVTCTWYQRFNLNMDREAFSCIKRMSGLQELYIRVDEKMMIRHALGERYHSQWWIDNDPTPQQQLAIYRSTGITGLLSLSSIPYVEFVKKLDGKEERGGPIPGGILETQIAPRLMSTLNRRVTPTSSSDDGSFPFFSLPPEVRNRIYELVLCFPGPIHPSPKAPSSAPKNVRNRRITQTAPQTALNFLAVNRQVNDEAYGIFYNHNSFEFYYPTQFSAFVLSLGRERQNCLRDITIYYQNSKNGGIDIAELALATLKQLSGLRRLHVILNRELDKRICWKYRSASLGFGWIMDKANPLLIPGIKTLFSLRGITDIKLRDMELEKDFEAAKEKEDYPNFSANSRQACIVKLAKVLEHFNNALADAQKGNVNKTLLHDPEWHMKEVFPTLNDEE